MKKLLFLILSLFSSQVYAQDLSIGIAPASFPLWGTTTGTSSVYAEYEFSGIFGSPIVGAYYFHQWDKKGRSEERRVGKECRERGWADHEKRKVDRVEKMWRDRREREVR